MPGGIYDRSSCNNSIYELHSVHARQILVKFNDSVRDVCARAVSRDGCSEDLSGLSKWLSLFLGDLRAVHCRAL